MSAPRTATFLCLLLHTIIGSHTAASQPVIVASPPEIDVGLSDTLDVNCTVSIAGWSSVAALISLTVLRNTSQTGWTELAIISDFSSGQVSMMTTENLTASGWFKAGASASVSLHWDYPTDKQAGTYLCSAQGFDSTGHSLVSNTDVQVPAHSPGLSDVQDKIREMDIQMKTQEEQLTLQIQKLELFDSKFKTLEEQLKQSQSKSESLEKEVSERKMEKQSRISQMFETSFEYKNHSYYVSRDGSYNIHVSQAICRSYGGYLAEIDDSSEYNAINTFLKSTSGFNTIYISGTDQNHEGTWTFLTGKPLPFVDWAPSQPDGLDDQDCMELYNMPSQGTWMMWELPCQDDEPKHSRRFMCEVPHF